MALDPIGLGRRLREARENRRLTQEAAAKGIGVSRTALLHIEAGRRGLSTLELTKLAKLYERTVEEFVREDENRVGRETDRLLILHRLPKELIDHPDVNREVSRCIELCRIGVDLEKALGMWQSLCPPHYEPPAPNSPAESTRQGERVADEERRRLGLGRGPIADMAELIATQGIWAAGVRNLPDEMSGIFLRDSLIRMVILVNFNHPRSRKRFSYAHEYAHALLDRSASVIVSKKANSLDLVERRANAFAAAFLLPSEGVRWFLETLEKGGPSRRYRVTYVPGSGKKDPGEPIEAEERTEPGSQEITYQDVAALAHYFGVSYPAAVYRLSDLGLINTAEKTSLIDKSRHASRLFANRDESRSDKNGAGPSAKPDRELTGQIVRLAVEAYRREEVSQGWLRDLSGSLEMSAETLLDLAEAATAG